MEEEYVCCSQTRAFHVGPLASSASFPVSVMMHVIVCASRGQRALGETDDEVEMHREGRRVGSALLQVSITASFVPAEHLNTAVDGREHE